MIFLQEMKKMENLKIKINEQLAKLKSPENVIAIVSFAFILILSGLYIYQNIQKNKILAEKKIEKEMMRVELNAFKNFMPYAKSYYVYDITDKKVISEKDSDKILPLASITKIMTSFIALRKLSPNEIVTINKEALLTEGDSGFFENEQMLLSQLVSSTMISSSNDGAEAIAFNAAKKFRKEKDYQNFFIELMNNEGKEIGLKSSYFNSISGLDDDVHNLPGATSTAREVSFFTSFAYLSYPSIFAFSSKDKYSFVSKSNFTHNFSNTDILISRYPNIIFSKTGFTDMAGGNLSILYKTKNSHIISIVVLGSTKDGRFFDVEQLINRTERHFFVNSILDETH